MLGWYVLNPYSHILGWHGTSFPVSIMPVHRNDEKKGNKMEAMGSRKIYKEITVALGNWLGTEGKERSRSLG